jgi:flavin-dependent dehydrogenase
MMRIAIVGAGPAGSSAGYHLAVRGVPVTLIDRAPFPRDKVCGDWLPANAIAELERLGLDAALRATFAPASTRIDAGAVSSPSGRATSSPLAGPACCIPRRRLDAAVRQRALDAGCVAMQRSIATPAPGAQGLHGFDLVIDARGAHAGTANAVGLRTYWTVPRAALDDGDASTVRMITDARYRRGYGWVFPVELHEGKVRFNVGAGLLAADSRLGHSVADFFARLCAHDPILRRLAARTVARERPIGYHVGLGTWRTPAGGAGVLRIGDAANLADPLTGDGIANALRSGRLVAEAIADSADGADAMRRWQRACAAAFAPELRAALVLRKLLQGTLAKNAAAATLQRSAWMRRRMHGALFGEIAYRALLSRRD